MKKGDRVVPKDSIENQTIFQYYGATLFNSEVSDESYFLISRIMNDAIYLVGSVSHAGWDKSFFKTVKQKDFDDELQKVVSEVNED